MIHYLSVTDAIQRLKTGDSIVLVDDDSPESECYSVSIAEATFQAGRLNHFCSLQGAQRIVLGYEKYGTITGAKKNSNFEYEIDLVNLIARETDALDKMCSLGDTVEAMIAQNATLADFRLDGVWQVVSTRQGGVLKRAAAAEAIIDLCDLAKKAPVGLLSTIADTDGKRIHLNPLALESGDLEVLSIADLIRFRRQTDILIDRIADAKMPTRYGEFQMIGFVNKLNGEHHVALVKGDVTTDEPVLVRVHSECLTGDSFGSKRCDCGEQLHTAMRRIEKIGRGIIIYMRQEGRGIGLINKIRAYALQDQGLDTVEANLALGFPEDLRDYGIGAQMLVSLGVKKIKLMTNNPKKIQGLSGYGIEIVTRVKIQLNHNERNEFYMRTKKTKMGHILDFKNSK